MSDRPVQQAFENAAQKASQNLFQAMRQQFFKFAVKHGVTVDDARLCCMNSWEPRR